MGKIFQVFWLGVLVFPSVASALIRPAMDDVNWHFKGDRFYCQLELPITDLGHAFFLRHAGEPLAFTLAPDVPTPKNLNVNVMWGNAPWSHLSEGVPYEASAEHGQFVLDEKPSQGLLDALDQGLWGYIFWGDQHFYAPSIHWQKAASQFRHCLMALAPMSYRQARDQVIFYRMGQRALDLAQRQHLAKLAGYIVLDKSIRAVLVDSYTDNTGSHLGNIELSRERAADVTAALVEAGVPKHLIQTRANGDRYPSTKNASTKQQDLNRRVTVRVLRKTNGT